MGIDLATWRARIGLNYYRQCRYACQPLRIQWRAARWGVGEVVNSTPVVLQGCMAVVSLSLILEYAFHKWGGCPKWRGGCGKVRCPKFGGGSVLCAEAREKGAGTGVSLLLQICVVLLALLLIAGDVERNPGPTGKEGILINHFRPLHVCFWSAMNLLLMRACGYYYYKFILHLNRV